MLIDFKHKKDTFSSKRRKYFDKVIDKYTITLKGGTIYYNGIQKVISYFPNAKFNDIEYIKIISHQKTPFEVFTLCWKIYVSNNKNREIINVGITKREL